MTTVGQRDVLVHALAADAKLEVEETANRGHAAALACRAMRDGVDVVVALGGDGTVNEVVNGLLTDGVHPSVPVLGVVPGGSTNVFARALGLPNDPVEATSVLIESMSSRRTRRIGLGMADDRWFLFTAGFGYDAAVVAAVEGHRRRGKTSTHSLYVRTAVRTFFAQNRRRPAVRLQLAEGHAIEDLYMALVNNCDPWTYLGSLAVSPTPAASFDAGLDVYARTRMGVAGILWAASRMIRADSGADPGAARPAGSERRRLLSRLPGPADRLTRLSGGLVEHDLCDFVLSADRPMPFQVDGDALDKRKSVRFRGIPAALEVFV
jgi:diacylglycerol kinase family enzyme